jgi:hypothetical protein
MFLFRTCVHLTSLSCWLLLLLLLLLVCQLVCLHAEHML